MESTMRMRIPWGCMSITTPSDRIPGASAGQTMHGRQVSVRGLRLRPRLSDRESAEKNISSATISGSPLGILC
jgi:hypothetical protein